MRLLLIGMFCMMALDLWAQDVDRPSNNAEADTFKGDEASMTQKMVVQETLKFGYLSYEDALRQMKGYHEAQQTITALRTAYDNELKRSEDLFSRQFAEYVDGQRDFPENILLKRQKELQQSMDEAIAFKKEAKEALEKKEKEVMDALRIRLDDAIRQVGTKHGFAFILNTDNNTYPFVNPENGTDITKEVLQSVKN